MSYFGKKYTPVAAFDPTSIVFVNTATILTAASMNKQYVLNTPATYTMTLPDVTTIAIGDKLTFIHNHVGGSATLAAHAGQFIQVLGTNNSSLTINPGDVIYLEFTGTVWHSLNPNKLWTAPQGTNDGTPANTLFVQNEFNKHKNYVINGSLEIWQRGTSSSTNDAFVADRWRHLVTGTTFTVSQQSFTLGQTAVPNEPRYWLRTITTSSAGVSNFAAIQHKIEGVRSLAGKTVTLTFYAKADASRNIAFEAIQYFGTGGSPSAAVVSIGVTTFALTTSWAKQTVTISIPSIIGKTLGTSGDDNLTISFWLDAGSNLNSRTNSLGQQSGTFDIAQVQLEEGNVSTQFEWRDPQTELLLCKRYYEKSYNLGTAAGASTPIATQTVFGGLPTIANTNTYGYVRLQPKRATPTVTCYNHAGTAAASNNDASVSYGANTAVPTNQSENGFGIRNDSGGNLVPAFGAIYVHWVADAEL